MKNEENLTDPGSELVQFDTDPDFDKLLSRAKKWSENLKILRKYALSETKPKDWCFWGENLRPRLEAVSDIAARIGVSWPKKDMYGNILLGDPEKKALPDGHYMYSVSGEMWWFGRRVTAMGIAASNKPFFSQSGKDKDGNPIYLPVDRIDEPSVIKNALTQFIVNGLLLITGLRNVSAEDLEAANINTKEIPKIVFKQEFKEKPITETEEKMLQWIDTFVAFVFSTDEQKQDWLEKATEFTIQKGPDKGKKIKGKRSKKLLTAKQISYVYKAARTLIEKQVNDMINEFYKPEGRKKALIEYSAYQIDENQIEPGKDNTKEMSNEALGTCFDQLLNIKLDRKAAEE